jgi:hypothetical protein
MRAPLVIGPATALLLACSDPPPPIAADPPPAPPRVVREHPEATRFLGLQVPADEIAPALPVACELGERRMCSGQIAVGPHPGPGTLWRTCRQWPDGMFRFDESACATPLVVSFDGAPVFFTTPPGSFRIGSFGRTAWVAGASPWLALDRDGSGCIEGEDELFGPPEAGGRNGFDKLAQLDDDGDGRIDDRDPAFARLVLWADRDQDRRCSAAELNSLPAAGIVAIELGYRTPAVTAPGSHEGEQATLWQRGPNGPQPRGRVVDVYLAPLP